MTGVSHFAESRKTRPGMLNPDENPHSRRQRLLRRHAASKQAQVAGLFDHLRL